MYYLISYDLQNGSSEDYKVIKDAIQNDMKGKYILRTTWIIYRKNTTAQSIATF